MAPAFAALFIKKRRLGIRTYRTTVGAWYLKVRYYFCTWRSSSSRCVGATLSFRVHHDFSPPTSSKFKISTSRSTGDVQVQFAGAAKLWTTIPPLLDWPLAQSRKTSQCSSCAAQRLPALSCLGCTTDLAADLIHFAIISFFPHRWCTLFVLGGLELS